MMSKVFTAFLFGLKGRMVQVEVDVAKGFPGYHVVGLAGTAIRESGYRVRSAMVNGGFSYPSGRITINLSPAESRKEGSHFDLPIAIGLLAAMGEISPDILREFALFGELSLDGKLTAVKGALPLASTAAEHGIKKVIIPGGNVEEAALAGKTVLYPAWTFKEVVEFFKGGGNLKPYEKNDSGEKLPKEILDDFFDVRGQESAKRALIISAAGGHGIWMHGSPGAGKTMMAKCFPAILPPMTYEEKVEVTNIYSVAGLLSEEMPFVEERPFRSPHHTITMPGLLGGGRLPRPGEFSLAHRGVLFLDELAQFDSKVLDALRQPLEDKKVIVARQGGAAVFPGKVILVAASNPCKCGYAEDRRRTCICSAAEIARYRTKLSAPFLDRIDLHVSVNGRPLEGRRTWGGMSSKEMREIVLLARERQKKRYRGESSGELLLNGELSVKELDRYCRLNQKAEGLLMDAAESLGLSMRTCHKTVKIARTIADMEEKEEIEREHIAEALQYRGSNNENHRDP